MDRVLQQEQGRSRQGRPRRQGSPRRLGQGQERCPRRADQDRPRGQATARRPGEDGVKEVLKIKKDAEDKVAAVDKVLDDEKVKDKGAKGVLEIVDARNKLTKDRDDLTTTLAAAFKELVDGNIVPASPDPRKAIV